MKLLMLWAIILTGLNQIILCLLITDKIVDNKVDRTEVGTCTLRNLFQHIVIIAFNIFIILLIENQV